MARLGPFAQMRYRSTPTRMTAKRSDITASAPPSHHHADVESDADGEGKRVARHRLTIIFLVAAFVAVGAAFVGSTLYTSSVSLAIDDEVASIESNSLPSVEHLTEAIGSLHELDSDVDQLALGPKDARDGARQRVLTDRDAIDHELMAYLVNPMYPGEALLYERVARALALLDRSLDELHESPSAETEATRGMVDAKIHKDVDDVNEALRRVSQLNTERLHEELARITQARKRATEISVFLDGACVLLAIVAAVFALRAISRQRTIERRHEAVLEDRATELEFFAKRVAHDLLSPLSALAFTLSTVKRNSAKGIPIAPSLVRADACLRRAQRLVEGVLDFARSGVGLLGHGSAYLRETLDGVLDETRASEEGKGIEIVVEKIPDVVIGCSPGVLTSILSNLVRNAVKYIGDRGEMRITIRAHLTDIAAHIEVEDTGPGLPPGFETRAFEPYVRADTAQPGLGLGLSTVRRFVEGHGGRVGVSSVAGKGCTFWFELPRVGLIEESDATAAPLSIKAPVSLSISGRGSTGS